MSAPSPLPTRYQLIVEYVGTAFHGSQRQPTRLSVQETLETALAKLVPRGSRPVSYFSGRTDSGVHALGNVVHVDLLRTDKEGAALQPMAPESVMAALNHFLPERCGVVAVRIVPSTFHARHSAVERSYVYSLRCPRAEQPDASTPDMDGGHTSLVVRAQSCPSLMRRGWASGLEAHRVLCITDPLDVDAMRRAAAHLVGTLDFSAFRSKKCGAKSPVRTLTCVEVVEEPASALDGYHIECGRRISVRVVGRSFLHHQVRYLVAVLLEVGLGKMQSSMVAQLLKAKDCRETPPPAPAHGLYLVEVKYPPEAFRQGGGGPSAPAESDEDDWEAGVGDEDEDEPAVSPGVVGKKKRSRR